MEDRDLIEQYAQRGCETAFTTLVNRYLGLVYSAALRRVGDAQAAQEIAQTVFCLLARKARQLPPDTPLAGWLHQTVGFTAARHWRAESRRRHREQQAASFMISNESAKDTTWDELAPHLDEAVNDLGEPDRTAILLRFFQDKAFPEVGRALGISEDGARMRVNRAVDKLRAALSSRNITCSTAALGVLLLENTMATVPAAAATAIRAAALAAAKTVGAPSILATILALLAKAKLESAVVAGLYRAHGSRHCAACPRQIGQSRA